MIIVDAHQDIAYNAYCFDRDYLMPAYKKRRIESVASFGATQGPATTGLPDALLGRVALVFATLFVAPHDSVGRDSWNEPVYRDAREAFALARQQLAYYERLAGQNERIRLVKSIVDLDSVLATWTGDRPYHERIQGLLISMEGADPIREPKQFEEWYEWGVRAVGPAWSKTRYTGGTGVPGPLTPLGFELLDILADSNVLLDLSHLSESAYYQAVERYEGPLIASHSNPRRFRDSDRHLSDEMIRLLAERDGVMGVAIYNRFLNQTWKRGDSRRRVPLETVVDVIDHVCQTVGSARHVGIGSDLDGGFGLESIPQGLDTVADLWLIGPRLRERGYTEADVEAVLSGNFLRKVRESLPSS